MAQNFSKNDKISLDLDISELNPAHLRLIKTLNNMIIHLLSTDEEEEYFKSSAEVVRLCASLIKQAHFTELLEERSIPYAKQALEFSIDALQEYMAKSKIVTYDC